MRLQLEINDIARSGIKKEFVRKIADFTLKRSGYDFSAKIISASFAVVSSAEIKRLNRIYRHTNEATDVLSFPEYENQGKLASGGDKLFLGEVILCYNFIKVNAHGNRLGLEQELARIISHAVLHLLGFRHGKAMFKIQDAAADIYPINSKRKNE